MTEISDTVSLFGKYPRVVGHPIKVKIVNNIRELNEYISKNISNYDLHLSLYSFSSIINTEYGNIEVDWQSAHIDKTYFDVDNGDWIRQMQDLQKWCQHENILHTHTLSSYLGGHFYIGCLPQIRYKKTAVRNFQNYLIKKLNIKIAQADRGGGGITILGDIARSFRIPNTFNFKRNCYCIPLTSDELSNLHNIDLEELTKKPRKNDINIWYGNKLVNLQCFDKKEFMYDQHIRKINLHKNNLLSNDDLKKLNIPFDKFPPCIQKLIKVPNLGFYGRYLLVLYLRDQKYVILTDTEIVSILKSVLNEQTWIHCSTNRQLPGHHPGEKLIPVKLTLSTLSYKFPSCKQMKKYKMCPDLKKEKCKMRWHPIFS